MHWTNVDAGHLAKAMDECKRVGLDDFRKRYGFKPANTLHMWKGSLGPFEARCLIASAYAKQFNSRISPRSFKNNDAHDFLVALHGYTAEAIKKPR